MTYDFEYENVDENWRNNTHNDLVMLDSGLVVTENEVYFAVEKLTPYLQEKEERFPDEYDIETFILILRGP